MSEDALDVVNAAHRLSRWACAHVVDGRLRGHDVRVCVQSLGISARKVSLARHDVCRESIEPITVATTDYDPLAITVTATQAAVSGKQAAGALLIAWMSAARP